MIHRASIRAHPAAAIVQDLAVAAASREFLAHCTELLGSAGPVRARRMFGGHGLYISEHFAAIVSGERLYLKVDDATRAAFVASGAGAFVYDSAGKSVSLGYFSAPDEAMESPSAMQPWARLALAAALRASAAKTAAARPARKARPRNGSASKAAPKV
jgi:DNA transformation protein